MMDEAPWLREQAKVRKMKAGTMGLVHGHQPHILDAIELGHAAWDKISEETIARWVLHAFREEHCAVQGEKAKYAVAHISTAVFQRVSYFTRLSSTALINTFERSIDHR